MPQYQSTRNFMLIGRRHDNITHKGLPVRPGDIIDYDPTRKEFYFKSITAVENLDRLITKGILVLIGPSPIYDLTTTGTIHASDIIFDPTGDISATNVQDAIEETYAESLQAEFFNEVLPVTTNGQTIFLLSQVPYSNEAVSLFVNSAVYINGVDFSVSGNVITWLNTTFVMGTSDQVVAAYFVDTA